MSAFLQTPHEKWGRALTSRIAHAMKVACALWLFIAATTVLNAAQSPQPSGFERVLVKIVAQLMATQHYTHNAVDDDVSSQLFEEFFNALDPERRFFLASDIEDFAIFRYQLDDHLGEGRVDFAYLVFERFLQRVRERVEYARTRLEEDFDFTLDESLLLDRSEEPWAKTPAELDEIWRRHLKNRVLVFTLMEESAEADATDDNAAPEDDPSDSGTPAADEDTAKQAALESDDSDSNATEASEAAPAVEESPQQKVLKAQSRYLRLLEEYESLDVLELYLGSLARIYDPHSMYMAPATEEDFDINMSLSLEGIGAVLTTEDGYVKIVDIIPGGPAESDGRLKAGDRITAVQQKDEEPVDVVNMPLRKVVRMIRGPKGSTVTLTVIEAGKSLSSMPRKIDIVRDEVKLSEREAKSELKEIELPIDHESPTDQKKDATARRVMVISLPSFYADFTGKREGKKDYKSASRDVQALLTGEEADNVQGVILDLRGNGGGSLEEAIKLAGFFFRDGPVVQVRSSGNKKEVYRDPDPDIVYNGPLVILVDRLSASASEIVAACIKDYNRAVVVGDNGTHGKGTVQTVLELNRFFARHPVYKDRETGALKFTIAKFYRINGESTQRRGVTPHIVLPSFHDNMDLGEDKLKHALPWDEITPLDANSDLDISPYLPILKQRSQSRLADDEAFQERLGLIAEFAELQKRKTLTLNKRQRAKLQEEEDKLMERVRDEATRRRRVNYGNEAEDDNNAAPEDTGTTTDNDENPDAEETPDLMMQEALAVISDLIWLREGNLVAEPAVGEQGEDQEDERADTAAAVRSE